MLATMMMMMVSIAGCSHNTKKNSKNGTNLIAWEIKIMADDGINLEEENK